MTSSPNPELDACGCCEGLSARTPLEVYNRPGLSAIAYRVGTYASFKQTLLARLSGGASGALRGLNTRADDDFAIALLDAWATVEDVLTFYQERIANESYVRTATERVSLLHLARLIGYELRPGVAANTALAFVCEEIQSLPPVRTTVPAGSKVQSVPEPGEQPQLFETIEAIEARGEWNALRPRRDHPHPISTTMSRIVLPGLSSVLKPGDSVLIVAGSGASNRVVKRVQRVVADTTTQTVRVELDSGSVPQPPADPAVVGQAQQIAPQTPLDEGLIKEQIITRVWRQDELASLAATRGWPLDALVAGVNEQAGLRPPTTTPGVFALRQRAALFGHNAILWNSLSANLRFGEQTKNSAGTTISVAAAYPDSWEQRTLQTDTAGSSQIHLDMLYPGIVKGSWLVLENASGTQTGYMVQNNVEVSRSAFAISAKVSRLTLDSTSNFGHYKLRETAVLAESEQLELAEFPDTSTVSGSSITLDRAYFGLESGRRVVVSGERSDLRGVTVGEVLTLDNVMLVGGYTRLHFTTGLQHVYVRDTVAINANVARATHGESVAEVLGSGDARVPYQRFTLRQPPLTYTAAATPSGVASTLEVRVDDVLWHEVPTLFGHGPSERIYTTRTDDEGRTIVQFGDGVTGARLPTGTENVRAGYRKGTGAAGMLKAEQLSLLMTRPLGVREVKNPLPAADGADPESRDEARLNLPLAMLTLDRIVSLQDYEDFARAFIGIARALATWTWNGRRRGVFVTVAGADGADVQTGGVLYTNLLAAMLKAGDPSIPLRVQSYRKAFFRLAAGVKIHPDHQAAIVLQEVEQALRAAFSFAARGFGRPVTLSEVTATIQHVPGVEAVNVTKLYRSSPVQDAIGPLPPHLVAALPYAGADFDVQAAELLALDPAPLSELGTLL